jgi:ribosomal protein S27E
VAAIFVDDNRLQFLEHQKNSNDSLREEVVFGQESSTLRCMGTCGNILSMIMGMCGNILFVIMGTCGNIMRCVNPFRFSLINPIPRTRGYSFLISPLSF